MKKTTQNRFNSLTDVQKEALEKAIDEFFKSYKDNIENINRVVNAMPLIFEANGMNLMEVMEVAAQKMVKGMIDLFEASTYEEARARWEELRPYVDRIEEMNPDKYSDVSMGVLIADAAELARSEGAHLSYYPSSVEMLPAIQASDIRDYVDNWYGRAAMFTSQEARVQDLLMQIPEEALANATYDENGKLDTLSLRGFDLKPMRVNVNTPFFMSMLQTVMMCDIREQDFLGWVAIHLPSYFGDHEIDIRPRSRDENGQLSKREPYAPEVSQRMRVNRFISLVKSYHGALLSVPGFGEYPIVSYGGWDKKTDCAYVAFPGLFALRAYAFEKANRGEDGEYRYITNYFHASIMNEKTSAADLAYLIAEKIILRGIHHPDWYEDEKGNRVSKKGSLKSRTKTTSKTKTVVKEQYQSEVVDEIKVEGRDENGNYVTQTHKETKEKPLTEVFIKKIRFSELIADCRKLQDEIDNVRNRTGEQEEQALKELEELKSKGADQVNIDRAMARVTEARAEDHVFDSKRINRILEDRFNRAIQIIETKSDFCSYYKDLTVYTDGLKYFEPPTSSKLKGSFIFQHHGKNPNYVNPAKLPEF